VTIKVAQELQNERGVKEGVENLEIRRNPKPGGRGVRGQAGGVMKPKDGGGESRKSTASLDRQRECFEGKIGEKLVKKKKSTTLAAGKGKREIQGFQEQSMRR